MKLSIWDILTGFVLLATLCMILAVGALILNPGLIPAGSVSAEVLPPLVPTISVPTVVAPMSTTAAATPAATATTFNPPPGLRPSSTPIPTNTPFVLPTFTPGKPSSSTTGGTTSGGGVSGGNCQVTYQDPADNSIVIAGASFTTRWTIKNTSGKTWPSDSVDIRLSGGEALQVGSGVYDLPYDINNGESVDISIQMRAPTAQSEYVSNWAMYNGATNLCRFFIKIKVQ